jgi:predicted DCC family thiol-disulfide oxidoreductase YuxK
MGIVTEAAGAALCGPAAMNEPTAGRSVRWRMVWLSSLFGAALTTWLIVSTLAVPTLIEQVYRGQSWPALNRLIAGQSELPLEFYLQRWNVITIEVAIAIVGCLLLALIMTSEWFARRSVGAATPGTLGAIRMWTCGILLVSTVWDNLGSIARLPLEYHLDMGVMRIAHALPIGFDRLLTSESGLGLWQRVTEVALFLGLLGWRTRLVLPLCVVLSLVMNGILREYTGFWHQNLVPIYVLLVLSFTPCGDGWSVDRLRRIYRGEPVADADTASLLYGWARYACWVPIALTYASAGFSKIRAAGLGWISADAMRAQLYEQTLYPRAGNMSISMHLAHAPDWVFVFLAVAAVTGEGLFILVLYSRLARKIFPAVAILMHIGIIFLQNIVFLDLIFLPWIFYDFRVLRQRVSARLRRRGTIDVLYDGDCPLCRRTVRIMAACDLFSRLEFKDFRRIDLAAFERQHSIAVDAARLEHEMGVRACGTLHMGYDAYRRLAWALPALWALVLLELVPGVRALGQRAYMYVARRRTSIATCDASCAPETSTPGRVFGATFVRPTAPFAFGCGVAMAVCIAVQGYVWTNRLEFYPFTSVQMFTDPPRTLVTYFKTLARLESGDVTPIQLERTLPVMSINSRYEELFMLCFSRAAENIALCKKTLGILGSAYNEKAAAGRRVTQLEIQKWRWDFAAQPEDPERGSVIGQLVADVSAGSVGSSDGTAAAGEQSPRRPTR